MNKDIKLPKKYHIPRKGEATIWSTRTFLPTTFMDLPTNTLSSQPYQ